MTWATFFKSRPVTYGSLAGVLGFIAGAGSATLIALNLESYCATAVGYLNPIGTNITIPELSSNADIHNHNRTITWNDINIVLPADWVTTVNQLINHAYSLPNYCFYLSLTIGLCLVTAMSLSLASTVAIAIHIGDEQKRKEALQRQPSFHKAPSFPRGHSFDYISVPPEI